MVRHTKERARPLGRGCHTREVATFGSLLRHQEPNRALFEEQVDIIFNTFNNERFSHEGKFYTLPIDLNFRHRRSMARQRECAIRECGPVETSLAGADQMGRYDPTSI